MTHQMRAVHLSGGQILRALPLVQLTWPGADYDAWERYVAFVQGRTNGKGSGVIALGDEDDYVSGLIVYESERDLEVGAILTIHLFTALDLANSGKPIRMMLDAAVKQAADLRCDSLQIRLHPEQAASAAHLRALGLVDRGGCLWKNLVAPAG